MQHQQTKYRTRSRGRGGGYIQDLLPRIPSIATVFLLLLVAATSVFGQRYPSTDYDLKRTEQTARYLMNQHRYSEAIAFLNGEIVLLPEDRRRFGLYKLLVDCLLDNGNLDSAQKTIAVAEKYAAWNWDHIELDRFKRRHSEMQDLLSDSALAHEMAKQATEMKTHVIPSEPRFGSDILVSNSFFEADLRTIMSDLTMETGIPILWDPNLKGMVTYEAVDKPLPEVLDAVLLPLGFAYTVREGVVYVGSTKPTDPAFTLLSTTEVITLANIKAPSAVKMLSEAYEPYVKADEISNTVCVTGPQIIVDRIRVDMEKLDQPPPQISIEVIIAEVSKYGMHKLGMDFSLTQTSDHYPWKIITNHTNIENPTLTADYTEIGKEIGGFQVDMVLALEALVQSGDAKIRANPRLTTMHGRKATIGITTDQYFVIQTSSGTQQGQQYNSLQSVTSGIKLEITPFASKDGEITVEVKPEVGDVVGEGSEGLPEISVRSASTSVRVKDGETFTIGGLNLEQEKKIRKKLPLLGDLPLLGYLFRYDESQVNETEVIIFITPRLLDVEK